MYLPKLKWRCLLLCAALHLVTAAGLLAGPLDDLYQLGPDSLPQEGVPRGRVIGPLTHASQVFPIPPVITGSMSRRNTTG
jgi:hypothetical protein